jgi:hypothetical protein
VCDVSGTRKGTAPTPTGRPWAVASRFANSTSGATCGSLRRCHWSARMRARVFESVLIASCRRRAIGQAFRTSLSRLQPCPAQPRYRPPVSRPGRVCGPSAPATGGGTAAGSATTAHGAEPLADSAASRTGAPQQVTPSAAVGSGYASPGATGRPSAPLSRGQATPRRSPAVAPTATTPSQYRINHRCRSETRKHAMTLYARLDEKLIVLTGRRRSQRRRTQ